MLIQTQKVRTKKSAPKAVKNELLPPVQPAMLVAKLQAQVKNPNTPRI